MAGPSGNDRYSTEVVLSRFKGELTLLGGRGESGGGGGDFGNEPGVEGPSQRSVPPARGPSGGQGRGGAPSIADELDDDIPF